MERGSGEMSDLDAALPYRDSLDGLSPPPGGSPALFLGDGAAALPSVVSRPPLPGVAARPGAAAYGAPQPSSAAPHPGAASSAAALPGEAAGSRSSAASRLQMNQSEVSGLLRLGMHETDGGEESYAAECSNMNQDTFHEATKFDVAMTTLAVFNDHGNTSACLDEYHMPGIQPSEEIRFGSRQHCERQSEGMVADSEEESIPSSPDTSSTTNYDMPGYTEHNLQHIYNAYEAIVCPLVDKEGPVVLSPDFIMCDKTVHLEPHLTFSSDGIQIEYLEDDSCEDNKMIALHWEISNIISISCKWVHSVGHAFITLLAGSEAEIGNSGPVSVQFCLDDLQWPRKQHNIWHLGARYQEIWKDIASDDFDSESIEPNLFFPRQYFSSTVDFEDVIYPKGDPDAVSISKRDAELLLPETFVNDTIIDFYIKYLSTRIESIEKCRYHFFNSFFFRKLADLDKDQGRAPDGRAAFLRVRKWTRKINIFEKDFLFIPVNFNLHWSLIVICYPGEVATFEDGQKKLSAKLPCILHMDSLKGSHIGLKDIIQSYLFEEWKERHPESASDNSDKFLNLRFVSLELPQQDNSFDCGLFLLHYVELFLMDAPSDFNPLKIDVFSDFLSDDWFPPAEASLKRSVIQKLINELVTGSFQNYPELACSNEKLDESYHGNRNAKLELAGEFLAQRCSAGEPESVCTTHDGTHGTESSTSICLNDSEGKGLHASGWMLGKVSMVAEQNLQEPRVCTPDENTVCLSSQDEKNEPLLTESNNHLNMRSCAPEDAEMLKGSSCVVTDKEHKESLLVSLDDNQKVSSQAEVEVQDTMVSRCCSISENAEEVIACQEHSLQRNTDEAGDECYKPSQDVDSFMMLDTSKDDLGSNLAGTTGEGDGSDICEDMDSVRLGDMNKDIADTKHKDGLADPLTVENATNDSAKEISTTEDNINPSEKYVSSELTEGTTNNGLAGDISKLKVGSADNGTTGDSAVSCDLNQGNTYQVMGGDCTNQTDGEDANQYLVADGAVPCEDDTTCSDAEMSLVDGPCREKNETVPENTISDVKSPQPDGICEEKDIVVSGDKCVQKDDAPGTDAKRPLPDGICEENDIVVSGDKSIQKDITHGTDMKIERHYKRRKVLAAELERQRSSSSLD